MMTIESGNSVSFSWSGSSSSLCNVVALSRIVILSKRHLLPIILIQGAIKGSAVAEHLGMALSSNQEQTGQSARACRPALPMDHLCFFPNNK